MIPDPPDGIQVLNTALCRLFDLTIYFEYLIAIRSWTQTALKAGSQYKKRNSEPVHINRFTKGVPKGS